MHCTGAVLLFVTMSSSPSAQSRAPLVQSVDMQVPVAPIPVTSGGKRYLAYELHVTNFRTVDVALTRLEVLDADRGSHVADFGDAALTALLGRPGVRGELPDKRVIGAGMRAVANFWLALADEAAVPAKLLHRIELDLVRPEGREHVVVQDAPLAVRKESPVVLSAPLRGGPWVGLYDPRMERGHRTSIYVVDGRARIPARFAIDWVRLDEDAKRARGDDARVENWYGYGEEVLAVADGIIAEARDDMSEDATLGGARGPMPLENGSGNYVTLDLGGGRYAFYEHLKHGSVRVKEGERVKSGQVIGQLGNSGSSSSGPHLHFHVSDANATLAAEGLPYVLRSFEVIGAFDSIGAHADGVRWKPVSEAGGRRSLELPAPNVVVMFAAR